MERNLETNRPMSPNSVLYHKLLHQKPALSYDHIRVRTRRSRKPLDLALSLAQNSSSTIRRIRHPVFPWKRPTDSTDYRQ